MGPVILVERYVESWESALLGLTVGGADQVKVRWRERSDLQQMQWERRGLCVLDVREEGKEEGTDKVGARMCLRGHS